MTTGGPSLAGTSAGLVTASSRAPSSWAKALRMRRSRGAMALYSAASRGRARRLPRCAAPPHRSDLSEGGRHLADGVWHWRVCLRLIWLGGAERIRGGGTVPPASRTGRAYLADARIGGWKRYRQRLEESQSPRISHRRVGNILRHLGLYASIEAASEADSSDAVHLRGPSQKGCKRTLH